MKTNVSPATPGVKGGLSILEVMIMILLFGGIIFAISFVAVPAILKRGGIPAFDPRPITVKAFGRVHGALTDTYQVIGDKEIATFRFSMEDQLKVGQTYYIARAYDLMGFGVPELCTDASRSSCWRVIDIHAAPGVTPQVGDGWKP